MDLFEVIKKSRPNLKESSIKTYINNLNKLAKEIGIKEIKNLDFLKNGGNIIRALQKKKEATQKTYLASIVVILKAIDTDERSSKLGGKASVKKNLIDFYTEKMNELMENYNQKISKKEKTESQEQNWIELAELKKEIEKQGKEITRMRLWDKKKLSPAEFDQIQKYVAGALYLISDENPPLRSDYADMKLICDKDYNNLSKEELKDNYIVDVSKQNKFFHLGDYKTNKTYGNKKIKVGKKLNNILNKWFKINGSGYLLVNNRKKPMTANSLGKYMNKVFEPTGKKIGVSLLRHIYISDRFPAEKLDEKEKVANMMLHSVSMQNDYSKK